LPRHHDRGLGLCKFEKVRKIHFFCFPKKSGVAISGKSRDDPTLLPAMAKTPNGFWAKPDETPAPVALKRFLRADKRKRGYLKTIE